MIHILDFSTRYSVGDSVENRSMTKTIEKYELCSVSQSWHPSEIQADFAFRNNEFKEYLMINGTNFRPTPSLRHHKNYIESKNRIIRDIFFA